MTDRKFYVYEHWRPDRGECFYVGKGHGRRAYDMRRGRNRWHKFMTSKLAGLGTAVEIRIIADGLTEAEAFEKEIERITFWRNDGADLCNLTDGGDGPSGYKFSDERKASAAMKSKGRKHTPEARAKMSAAAMGNKKGLGKKKPRHLVEMLRLRNTGRTVSTETRKKIAISKAGQIRAHTPEEDAAASARMMGVPKSDETRRKMSLHKKSDAHKEKLRAISLAWWVNKKAEKAFDSKE